MSVDSVDGVDAGLDVGFDADAAWDNEVGVAACACETEVELDLEV
jgi:hypothetical protein